MKKKKKKKNLFHQGKKKKKKKKKNVYNNNNNKGVRKQGIMLIWCDLMSDGVGNNIIIVLEKERKTKESGENI